jgi:hypothetical protein
MENAVGRYPRQSHPQNNAQAPDTGGHFTRLTAVFRIRVRMGFSDKKQFHGFAVMGVIGTA